MLMACVVLAGCSARGLVKSGIDLQQSGAPTQILVAPADFVIQEVGVGKTAERVVEWERQAQAAFEEAINALSDKNTALQIRPYMGLSAEDIETIEQHRALFATMVSQLLLIKEGPVKVWTQKKDAFNYTLGSGMAEIGRKHGIEAIVFVVGKDQVRSTGRIILDTVNTILPGASSMGAQYAYLAVGIVDVPSGDILLFDNDAAKRKKLSDKDDMRNMADNVLTDYKRLLESSKRIK